MRAEAVGEWRFQSCLEAARPAESFFRSVVFAFRHSGPICHHERRCNGGRNLRQSLRLYVSARLDQKQPSIDTRANMLFSPRASLQLYMQPLVVAGDYSDFKSLVMPRTFESNRTPRCISIPISILSPFG
jgi:hypothetical protein